MGSRGGGGGQLPHSATHSTHSTPSASADADISPQGGSVGGEVAESLAPKGVEARWFFPSSELRSRLPSIRPDFPPDRELKYRQRAAGFIQDMGEKLNHNVKEARARISQLCLSAAMVHMHRFYVFHPFQTFDYRDMGATALFLAGKMEDCPRKLEHIVIVWHRLKHPTEPPLHPSQEKYHQGAQLITTLENILLQTIAFDLEIKIPHSVILSKPKTLGFHLNKDVIEAAYWFASDILHMTTFCIRYRPSALAVLCFHLSSHWADAETPNDEDGRPWYYSLDPELSPALADSLSNEFVSIRRAADQEGRTKALRSTEFFKKRKQQEEEAREKQANQAGASPLPPPPQPPPTTATPAATATASHSQPPPPPTTTAANSISLDRYWEKRSSAQSAQEPSVAPRKSFIPDMSAENLAAAVKKEKAKDGQSSAKPSPGNPLSHNHHSHSQHSHKRHRQDEQTPSSSSKRPRQEWKEKSSHYPPHYREDNHHHNHHQQSRSSSHSNSSATSSRKRERSRDVDSGNRGSSKRGAGELDVKQLLPPPPPPPPPPPSLLPPNPLHVSASTPANLCSLASIPIPPPQPGMEGDLEEGEVMEEEDSLVPLPPGAPPPLPPPPPLLNTTTPP